MTHPNTCKQRGCGKPRFRVFQAAAAFVAALLSPVSASGFTDLTPAAERIFQRYTELTEARMKQDFRPGGAPEERARVRNGEIRIAARTTLDGGREIKPPEALIQDWSGAMFIQNTTIAQVRAVMQAYPKYKNLFAPEVIESRLIRRDGDRFEVFLRLYKKQILTVVLNATYDIRYSALDSKHLAIDSHSTRIAEVRDPKRGYEEERPVGHDNGFLWRLNTYWRFEEADGGVYAECEAVSLSRDVPFGLSMIRKFIERFPRESMENTLEGVRRAVVK